MLIKSLENYCSEEDALRYNKLYINALSKEIDLQEIEEEDEIEKKLPTIEDNVRYKILYNKLYNIKIAKIKALKELVKSENLESFVVIELISQIDWKITNDEFEKIMLDLLENEYESKKDLLINIIDEMTKKIKIVN